MPRRGLIALVGALAFSLLLPPLFDGLPLRGQRALAITLITIVLWTTRGLDAGVTALLGIALPGSSGAAGNFRQALAGFANPVPYFLVGVLAMGVAVARSGLAAALTFLLPSATTRSGILVHIYEEVFGLVRVPAGAAVIKAVMLALASITRGIKTSTTSTAAHPRWSADRLPAGLSLRSRRRSVSP